MASEVCVDLWNSQKISEKGSCLRVAVSFRNQGWRQSVRHLGEVWGKPGVSDSMEPADGRFPAIRSWVGTLGSIKAVPRIFFWCVKRYQIVDGVLGRPEISRRSMTGWLCVKKRKDWKGFM